MYVLKGFITNARFTSNVIGVVAPIGELSTQALTYAREKGLYKAAGAPELSMTTFVTAQDDAPITLTSDISDHVIGVSKFIYDRNIAIHGQIFADELVADLLTHFAGGAESFECGEIISDGTTWMPEWISWKATAFPTIGTDNDFKVWFVNDSFISQFAEFQIVPVPPTDRLDNFFKTGLEVQNMIDALNPSDNMIRVQAAKEGYPESIIRSETYDYIDPYNSNHRIPVTWTLLIYGAAGDNIDAVTDELVSYILTNSSHSRDEWIALFPDLFRRTEFVLLPLWDQYSIPNREIETGIYSPTTNLKRAQALIKQVVVNYPGSHIDDHAEVMAIPYKSLSMMAIGSPDNRNNWYEITDVFSDYIAVFSTSPDFNRMSANTRGWVEMIAGMLIVAENMGVYSTIPLGMTKMKRDGILYLVKRYGNINYLIVAKKNFPLTVAGV